MNEEESVIISKKATRFGWIDFSINLTFSLIMIASIYLFIFFINRPTDITDWIVRFFVTIVPLLIFSSRVHKELVYMKDFITLGKQTIEYRSTPLLLTGMRVKKGEIQIRDIRKYGLSKIPRKLSLDLRKYKRKAMLVISLKDGREFFIGEYVDNDDLAEICLNIQNTYPKAKLVTNLAEDYPELAKKSKKLSAQQKSKQLDEEDEEPEGTGYRRR
ncbi:MAG: hypothetical protein KAS63_03870 [Candidatus Heimdallarchaeota archaeon]|nr:hypothetical protein [Candidatus Heimdallarchaeota archaeon]MCK4954471.1 hypothetical protein [Candidatus Heimdallarchaeota archaeon]